MITHMHTSASYDTVWDELTQFLTGSDLVYSRIVQGAIYPAFLIFTSNFFIEKQGLFIKIKISEMKVNIRDYSTLIYKYVLGYGPIRLLEANTTLIIILNIFVV